MAGYTYDFTAMEDVMSKMKTAGDAINEIISTIESKAAGLDEASWSGPSRTTYDACQGQWDKDAGTMSDKYATALQGLNQIHGLYGDTENNAQRMWQTLQTY